MNTVLKKQILGALCWEQKDSFKDLLLNLVYRIFLFPEPSKVFSIICFPNVFIFARIKPCSILRRTVPSAVVPSLFWVKHNLRKLATAFLSPDISVSSHSHQDSCYFLTSSCLRIAAAALLVVSVGTPAAFSLTSSALLAAQQQSY